MGLVYLTPLLNTAIWKLSKDKFNENDKLHVSLKIKNTGKIEGKEIVQLYIQDVESSLPRPLKELKGFQKVNLKPGESKNIQLKLTIKDFSFWNPETKNWSAEKGLFVLQAGSSSKDIRLKKEVELI